MSTSVTPASPAPAAEKPAAPVKTGTRAKTGGGVRAAKPVAQAPVKAAKPSVAANKPKAPVVAKKVAAAPGKPKAQKPVGKVPLKPVDKMAVKAVSKVAAPKQKPAKVKMVRDSFTFPQAEHERLVQMKKRLIALGTEAKKGELVRAGLSLLSALDEAALVKAVARVDKMKTGRPKK